MAVLTKQAGNPAAPLSGVLTLGVTAWDCR
jgi:hypothetical protein